MKAIFWPNDIIHFITGENTQAIISRQIKKHKCDIFIGILWKYFGNKQPNGLTPTEEEFEIAFRRLKKTGKPIIKFYFKLDEFYPRTPEDALQTFEIQNFREKIKNQNIGLYDEFKGKENFQKQIFDGIFYIIDNYESLTSKKKRLPKTQYEKIPLYLRRKIIKNKYFSQKQDVFLFSVYKHAEDILSVIKKQKRIVILGDAGTGKTTELKRIAWHFSNEDTSLFPVLLSLNKYANQKLIDLFPKNWSDIPENQLLIILDGLDEIESKNKNDVIRQIELFSEQHTSSHVIISSRTNFYRSETENLSGTIKGFPSYRLVPLESDVIEKYINDPVDLLPF